MAIAAILGSRFFAGHASAALQNNLQRIQHDVQLLGEDLDFGNLTQAQTNFAALAQDLPGQPNAASGTQVASEMTSPISQTMAQLRQDLKAGNLTAAQSDFATLQQELRPFGGVSTHRHHHHHSASSRHRRKIAPQHSSVNWVKICNLAT